MFNVVAGATLVDDHFVADCGDGFRTGQTAYLVQYDFGGSFRIAKDGNLDKLVQFERKTNVFHLIVADAVFSYLKYRVYVLRQTAKARALCTC